MSINYGQVANPGAYVMGILLPLNRIVEPERDEDDPTPNYVVNAIPGPPDRFSVNVLVSVHTFAPTHAEAYAAAIDADNLILSTSAGDVITLPDGTTAQGVVCPSLFPHYINYHDPRIKRYFARYGVEMRRT